MISCRIFRSQFKMLGSSGEQVEGMRQKPEDRFERGPGSCGASREIEDESAAAGSAHSPAQRSQRRLFESRRPHALGDALHHAIANRASSLRGDVAGCEAGPAGGDDQVRCLRVLAKGRGDLFKLIGKDMD